MTNGIKDRSADNRKGSSVAVVLAVYNGSAYLRDQLDTLAAQTVGKLDIIASDDGSVDDSRSILVAMADRWCKGAFCILDGPKSGFAENFRYLMTRREIDADYVAFCDQDDLWYPDKLATAVEWLSQQPPTIPALYCTRTITMTSSGQTVGYSPRFRKPPSFQNAIVQSIAGANTMVANRPAWNVIREASSRTPFVSHDWWCYLAVAGVGGTIHYSPEAKIAYRQHGGNVVGANHSWRARMSRLHGLATGRFVRWNDINITALKACEDMLTPEARNTISHFKQARHGNLAHRLRHLFRSDAYRQTTLGQVGLYLGCILNRL